ncbi:MAG TPA: hypothetical protein VFE13_01700 [Caulobacteraceae bacterium]|jgi:hypothetical protein|nr:hypothetical protein [Caulobacteraceae bacterium]
MASAESPLDGRIAVIGFRPHTYWTAAVALAGDPNDPQVIVRRRIDFASGDERGVYHQAEGMAPEDAEAMLARVWAAVEGHATHGLREMLADLGANGFSFASAVVPIGRKPAPERLEDILRSHSFMHAAEGDFYRAIVAQACANLGLAVLRVVEGDLAGVVTARLGEPVEARLRLMGAALGPPWSEDQKLATLAAWSAL